MADNIQIKSDDTEGLGKALLAVIESIEGLEEQLELCFSTIESNFKGPVADVLGQVCASIKNKMRNTIADAVKKNYDDIKLIQETFEEVDAKMSDTIDNRYQTSDYDITITSSETPGFGTTNATDYTVETNSGTQFKRK